MFSYSLAISCHFPLLSLGPGISYFLKTLHPMFKEFIYTDLTLDPIPNCVFDACTWISNVLNQIKINNSKLLVMPSPPPPHYPTFSFGNSPKAHENTTIYPAVQTKNLKSFLILPLPSRSASTKNSISQAQQFFHFSLILLLTNLQAQTSFITSRVQLILGPTVITIQFILRLA